jgi:hypothetical protein
MPRLSALLFHAFVVVPTLMFLGLFVDGYPGCLLLFLQVLPPGGQDVDDGGVGFREMSMVFGLLCLVYAPFVCCLKKMNPGEAEQHRSISELSHNVSANGDGGRGRNNNNDRGHSFSSARTMSMASERSPTLAGHAMPTNEHGQMARGEDLNGKKTELRVVAASHALILMCLIYSSFCRRSRAVEHRFVER